MAAAYSDDEIDELTCSVCFDLFTDPRMLNCGHSFCTGCLDQIIRNHQKSCPDCRQPLAENLGIYTDLFPSNINIKLN